MSLREAQSYCRRVAHAHYENFQIASFLIPRKLRQDFYNIYAFCRWADDCGDEVADPATATGLLHWWQHELEALYAGQAPRHPVMRALATTLAEHKLEQTHFTDLISAFLQDQSQRRYASESELADYCRRSANPVGRLVLGLARADHDPENLRLSDHICTGLQLANFCQDMARDARMDRIYAPRSLWNSHQVDEAQLLAAGPTPALQGLLQDWVAQAAEHLNAGAALVQRVPRWLATDVHLFRAGGLAILQEITTANYDVWTRRPKVSKLRKLGLLIGALVQRY
jgi:squalene synthase HpnC